jgi:hypothetical protein
VQISDALWREIEAAALDYKGVKFVAVPRLRLILKRSRRSNDQNALLWALYDDVIRKGGETLGGWTKDDLHEWALGEHFGWDEHKAFGRTRLKPKRRSSTLTKQEFTDFLDWFVRRMAEFGIVLELPGEEAA